MAKKKVSWQVCSIYRTNGSSTETHKSLPMYYGPWGGGFLKCVLIYLCCTKCNKIKICYLDIQKHVSYKNECKSCKYFVYKLTQIFPDALRPMGEIF